MKAVIFIGTNKSGSSREAVTAAERLGYFTIVFTAIEKQILQREEYTDVHKMILVDTSNISLMKKEIQALQSSGIEIHQIISFIDPYVHVASILCDKYCTNLASTRAIKVMENKEDTRYYLRNQPYTPRFTIIEPCDSQLIEEIGAQQNYPVIVKSSTSTGSKDVLLANNENQFMNYIARLQEKNRDDILIVEEYIVGDQYLVEAFIQDNNIQIAGIVKQEITHGKRFIITGYGVLARVSEQMMLGIEAVLKSIVTQLDIKNGALHLEMRLSKNGWKLIEINPRISGGAMNKMIQAAFGFNLVEETLKLYLGEKTSIKPLHYNYVFTQYLIVSKKGILTKVTGKSRAKKSPGVVDVYVRPRKGTTLIPPLSMGHRYAYVIAKGESLQEAKNLAQNAANEIEFHLSDINE